ncbi:MAG: aconitate hydratase [Verrucomicrobiota bacterium]|nr:aconitate hydratase [Verrucomicrobiota bacterium]
MGKSIVRKLIESHRVEGQWNPGSEIAIRIDQTLTQDATGTMTYLQFEAMGLPGLATELSVSYIDHNMIQIGFENADDHKYLRSIAAKCGIVLSRAGNGICHQAHLERFGKPGKTLLGADSHTPTGGGIGMLAIGAGGLDVAMAMGGAPFYLTCPTVVKIELTGRLKPWVSAKDVILEVLRQFGTKGNVNVVFEYAGKGALTLTVPERATIANMGAECGVTTSVFPSDEHTKAFLEAQGRGQDWTEIAADPDAEYDKTMTIRLADLVPLAATPHSPGNIATVESLLGIAVDQVCIGSCANSSYQDLVTVAKILKGNVAAPNVSLIVAPGSRQVLQAIAREGYLDDLIAAGARVDECACGFCIGNSRAPSSKGVSLRTSNRNFEGRSGTKDAQVYLVSRETAAAAAIAGRISDPRTLPMKYPHVRMPKQFATDDRMFIFPKDIPDPANVKICRGPNIGALPTNDPFPATVKGVVSIKVGDKITTDHIIPAGARMKHRSNIPKYSEFVFETMDAGFAARAAQARDSGKHNVIVGGAGYGEGSSREHAAICPTFLGVKVVLAKSFQRIHTDNLINFGILPLVFKSEKDYDRIAQGDELEIPDAARALKEGKSLLVKNLSQNATIEVKHGLTDRQKEILLAGGALLLRKQKAGKSAGISCFEI